MRRILAGLAVVGLLMVASPAQAETLTFSGLGKGETVTTTVTMTAPGTITAHAVWNAHGSNNYLLSVLPTFSGYATGCILTNDPEFGPIVQFTPPSGDWTCQVNSAQVGTYEVTFEVRSGGAVSGTLDVTST
jgi:hypothetical protein